MIGGRQDKYWHYGNPLFREAINVEGLIPQVGDAYAFHFNMEEGLIPKVFMCSDKNYQIGYDDDLYEIDNAGLLDLYVDTEVKNGYYTTYTIDKKYIKRIHDGTAGKGK